MAQPERFEILVLGSGQGGKLLAWDLARSGRRTAVVERRWIGGSCPNINCMPSKNEIWSANVAYVARHGAEFGTMTDRVAVDMMKVRQRKRDMVDRQVDAHLRAYKDSGTELIMGPGRFVAPKSLEVRRKDGGARVPHADKVLVNVGTHGTIPGVPGLEASGPLTSIEALEFDHVPPHLVVLGGGYVGVEFSQAYRRFGSRVTIIQHDPQLLSQEDPDISSEVQRILSAEGIECLVGAQTLRVHGRSGKDGTVPPLAHVGLSERDAHRQGVATRVAKLPMSDVLRVQAVDARPGLMKALVSASDDRILGFTMIGPEAGEVMAAVQAAMLAELPYPKLRAAALAHLTMAEGLGALLSNVPPL